MWPGKHVNYVILNLVGHIYNYCSYMTAKHIVQFSSPLPCSSLTPLTLLPLSFKDMIGRPDEEVAAEVLESHLQCNNSFIQNIFQGQFRSALICPSCSTRSCTFDPYVSISLPLPQRETKPVYVTVVHRGINRKMRVFGVNVSINGSIRELRCRLAELCEVHRYVSRRRHIILCQHKPLYSFFHTHKHTHTHCFCLSLSHTLSIFLPLSLSLTHTHTPQQK